jgi:hypothetical protein
MTSRTEPIMGGDTKAWRRNNYFDGLLRRVVIGCMITILFKVPFVDLMIENQFIVFRKEKVWNFPNKSIRHYLI